MLPTQMPDIPNPGATIPMTAWEQAVIVVLFCILVMAIMGGLYAFTRNILKQLQNFIKDQEIRWQTYFERRENSFVERNNAVVEAIRSLTSEVICLRDDMSDHDKRMERAVSIMEERTRPRKQVSTQK